MRIDRSFTRRAVARASIAAGLVLLASATASHAAGDAPRVVTVDIDKFQFVPRELVVEPGTTVRWTNHDEIPHTVTSTAARKVFASKALDTDDRYEFTFATEGDFAYFCTVHPMMTGVVHVRKAVR